MKTPIIPGIRPITPEENARMLLQTPQVLAKAYALGTPGQHAEIKERIAAEAERINAYKARIEGCGLALEEKYPLVSPKKKAARRTGASSAKIKLNGQSPQKRLDLRPH